MGERESKQRERALELAGKTAVRDAVNAARLFAAEHGIESDAASHLCIVVEELVANLYEHGNLAIDDRVDLTFLRGIDGIRIVLTDPGSPFDPRSAGADETMPERGGGAGINLVKRWATLVSYTVEPDHNRLELFISVRSH